jgi:hypothetical protein
MPKINQSNAVNPLIFLQKSSIMEHYKDINLKSRRIGHLPCNLERINLERRQ